MAELDPQLIQGYLGSQEHPCQMVSHSVQWLYQQCTTVTDIHVQTDIQTDRQTDRQTDMQADIQVENATVTSVAIGSIITFSND